VSDGVSTIWADHARLRCLACGHAQELGESWNGCPACAERLPLVVEYDSVPVDDIRSLAEALLPIRGEHVVDLGQGDTPLVDAGGLLPGLLLKLESQNPTGSHKDRFHTITAGVARALGSPGLVTSSTGNHGASAAACAAAAGLRSLICLHPDGPAELRSRIHAHGGSIALLPEGAATVIARAVDAGWCPSTTADPALTGRSNPYGQEGYKSIAYEIVEALGEAPGAVTVPAAGGDTLYGIWRGFRDLHELLGFAMPTLIACQPEGAASLRPGERPTASAAAATIALSAADLHAGAHAHMVIAGGGIPIEMPEPELRATIGTLARHGHFPEPASALAVAGAVAARRDGLVDDGRPVVAVVTASGQAWTSRLESVWGKPAVHTSVQSVLEAMDLA
jgi:threonine synthase